MLDIALLGCGGMMPLPGRFLTSLFIRLNGRFAMIDCGEGTQVSLKILGWGFKNIDVIIFTHFHADHISGLPGLLLTIGNSGREEPITLIGPKGLEAIVQCLTVISRELPFKLKFIELNNAQTIVEGVFHIETMPVEHRTACFAYSVTVHRPGKFNAEKALQYGIPKNKWSAFQRGENVCHDGKVYTPDMILGHDRRGIKVSYCTDSRPVIGLPDFVRESDIFVCEGIYGENEKLDKAKEYKHMLFSEAAAIAQKAQVKEMWLTHYSPSLTEPAAFLHNARSIFPNTKAGFDRKTASIAFEEY